MELRGWKKVAAVTMLGAVGAVSTSPYPARAYVFLREFERTSEGGSQVTIWERVVYSLIEAGDQKSCQRAPRTT